MKLSVVRQRSARGVLALFAAVALLGVAPAALAMTITLQAQLDAEQAGNDPQDVFALGIAQGSYDTVTGILQLDTAVLGLQLSDLTASPYHIHTYPEGGGPTGPITVSLSPPGSFFALGMGLDGIGLVFDEAAVINGISQEEFVERLLEGRAYLNLHTGSDDKFFPAGAIRGQISAVAVPEPTTLAMMGLGLFGLVVAGGRRA